MASKHKRYILLMSLLLSHKMILCLVCNYKHVGRETKIWVYINVVYSTMGTCKCFLFLMLYVFVVKWTSIPWSWFCKILLEWLLKVAYSGTCCFWDVKQCILILIMTLKFCSLTFACSCGVAYSLNTHPV